MEESEKKILYLPGNDTGRYIGILEISIVLFLVVSNNYSSIALVLTGKSIARNKEFENKEFEVKFIVSTFLSILIGIIGGEMFKVTMKYFIKSKKFRTYNIKLHILKKVKKVVSKITRRS